MSLISNHMESIFSGWWGYSPFFFDKFLVEILPKKCCLFFFLAASIFSHHLLATPWYSFRRTSEKKNHGLVEFYGRHSWARLWEALAISVAESCGLWMRCWWWGILKKTSGTTAPNSFPTLESEKFWPTLDDRFFGQVWRHPITMVRRRSKLSNQTLHPKFPFFEQEHSNQQLLAMFPDNCFAFLLMAIYGELTWIRRQYWIGYLRRHACRAGIIFN